MANDIKPESIPIGPCGGVGQRACDPVVCIVGADGKTYYIHGAAKIVTVAPEPAPEPVENSD
jgi:hypothetical protein